MPPDLTEPLEIPPFDGQTNRDLVAWALEVIAAISRANADRAAVRALGEPDATPAPAPAAQP